MKKISFKKKAGLEIGKAKMFLESDEYKRNALAISEAFVEHLSWHANLRNIIVDPPDGEDELKPDWVRASLVDEYKRLLRNKRIFKPRKYPSSEVNPNTRGADLFDWAEEYIEDNGLDEDPNDYTYDWLGWALHQGNLLHKVIMFPYLNDAEHWLQVWHGFLNKRHGNLHHLPLKSRKPLRFAKQDYTFVWRFLHNLFKFDVKGQHPTDYKSNLYLLKKHERENLRPDTNELLRFESHLGGKALDKYRAFYKKNILPILSGQERYASEKRTIPMKRTAGEVRFVKDNSNDASSWAWKQGPSERNMQPDYNYNPKRKKALAKVLRSTTASMGHAMSAYNAFTKIKSADVSPDGNLGGKGYIQKIMDMRKQYMNVVEALSALSDTIYDEINAPHWAAISRQETEEEKEEVAQIIQDAEEIKEDPEGWAEEQEEEMDDDHKPMARTASKIPKKYLRGDK